MDITIHPQPLQGEIQIIPSKSMAHRYLICSAFAGSSTHILCPETSQDMDATMDCLNALGANIVKTELGFDVTPIRTVPDKAVLNCRESGSTLRFLLPIVGALGVDTTIEMAGRLPQRPLSPLWEEMERKGCTLTRPTENTIRCTGKLTGGDYSIDGGVSSQFITGLYFALPLLRTDNALQITGTLESKPYVRMTLKAMKLFDYPDSPSPGTVTVEGDWSNGAFFLAAKALGSRLAIGNLDAYSPQGDRAVVEILSQLESGMAEVSARDIPDLVPILSVVAAANLGARFTDIRRLRLKESDRVASTIAMIENLGGKAEADENTLTVFGTGLVGGMVDAVNDHRIAMAAAIAATVCREDVTILGGECVRKSYPKFWEEYARLGGKYELNLR